MEIGSSSRETEERNMEKDRSPAGSKCGIAEGRSIRREFVKRRKVPFKRKKEEDERVLKSRHGNKNVKNGDWVCEGKTLRVFCARGPFVKGNAKWAYFFE